MSAMLSQMIAAALDGPDDLAEQCMSHLRELAATPRLPPEPAAEPASAFPLTRKTRPAMPDSPEPTRRPILLAPASYRPTDREHEVAGLIATIVERHQSRPPSNLFGERPPAVNWIMVGDRSASADDPYRALDTRDRFRPWSEQHSGRPLEQHVLDLASIRLLAKAMIRTHRPRATLSLHEEHGLVICVKGPIDQLSTLHAWSSEGGIGKLIRMTAPNAPCIPARGHDLEYRVDAAETWTSATTFDAGACLLVQSTEGRPWANERREKPYIMLRALWIRDVMSRLQHGPIELASSWYVMVRSPLMVCSSVGRVRSIPFALRRNLVQWSGIWADQSSNFRPQTISEAIGTRASSELNEYFIAPRQNAA